ncbi:MAG: 7-cyano-7-deazaguanine synthase QueC [Methanomicrobiales archaeon]|jgi:7-cyano-7-deazaguanine synthase|nr:7-cyano-7-deazaguanine synthase QueC [Methanomicrobiales archaeon]
MRAVCLLSGGMDSSTLAYVAKDSGFSLIALHANYGQRTEGKEERAARAVAAAVGVEEFIVINLAYFKAIGGSSLTDHLQEVDDFQPDHAHIPTTYVPFRNANLLAIATSYAEARGASAIFIGVQSQDYSGYPDCRPAFIEAFQSVISHGTRDETDITLMTPFVMMTKAQILQTGLSLGVPYALTWSCYRNEGSACGRCGSCHFRLMAFDEVGVRDPIKYEV